VTGGARGPAAEAEAGAEAAAGSPTPVGNAPAAAGSAPREVVRVLTRSAAGTRAVAAAVAGHLVPGDVVVLSGDLGAGKTVFAKGTAAALGVDEPVVSPTFAIVRRYEGRLPVVHVDVYRLGRIQEVLDLDLDELFGDDRVTIVEWGEAVAALLPGRRLEVGLAAVPVEAGTDPAADDERVLTLRSVGDWGARLPALLAAVAGFEPAGEEPGC